MKSIKNIKRIALSALVTLSVTSCDTRKDSFIDKIQAPTMKINSVTKPNYTDNLVDSLKSSQGYFMFNYSEHSDTKSFNVELLKGNGLDSTVGKTIYYKPSLINQNNIYDVKITDAFGKTGMAHLSLYYFNNMSPVAVLGVRKTAIHDPREYEIDASNSFDQDKNFGGSVSGYTFTINSVNYPVLYNKMNYIFPAAGNYSITVICKDNENALSVPINTVVAVN